MNVQPMVYNLCGIFFKSLSSATKTTKNKTTETINNKQTNKDTNKKRQKKQLTTHSIPLIRNLGSVGSILQYLVCMSFGNLTLILSSPSPLLPKFLKRYKWKLTDIFWGAIFLGQISVMQYSGYVPIETTEPQVKPRQLAPF